jgi:hypothetical protein
MKGKKLFYIALFCSLIVILYGCNEKNNRAYLEDRIGAQVSRVYPTKNLEDLFEQFPNGFTIYQTQRKEDVVIDVELKGTEKGKPIEGYVAQISRKSGNEEKKIKILYANGTFSSDDEEGLRELWPQKRLLFQGLTFNKEILSQLDLKNKAYSMKNGDFELEYAVHMPDLNQYFNFESSQQVELSFHGSNSNKKYYYSVVVRENPEAFFRETVSE